MVSLKYIFNFTGILMELPGCSQFFDSFEARKRGVCIIHKSLRPHSHIL